VLLVLGCCAAMSTLVFIFHVHVPFPTVFHTGGKRKQRENHVHSAPPMHISPRFISCWPKCRSCFLSKEARKCSSFFRIVYSGENTEEEENSYCESTACLCYSLPCMLLKKCEKNMIWRVSCSVYIHWLKLLMVQLKSWLFWSIYYWERCDGIFTIMVNLYIFLPILLPIFDLYTLRLSD
jgi:hypothetical protein